MRRLTCSGIFSMAAVIRPRRPGRTANLSASRCVAKWDHLADGSTRRVLVPQDGRSPTARPA